MFLTQIHMPHSFEYFFKHSPFIKSFPTINLLEWLTELRESFPQVYQFIIKDDVKGADESPDQDILRWDLEGGPRCRNFCPHGTGVCHSPGTWMLSPTWKLISSRVRVLWSLICNVPLPIPFPFPEVVGGSESVNPLITGSFHHCLEAPPHSLISIISGVLSRGCYVWSKTLPSLRTFHGF